MSFNGTTLEEAKQFLRDNWEDGVGCPCCKQFVKKYKRKITSAMAYGLIKLVRYNGTTEPIHIENFFKGMDVPSSIRGDISKLKYWGFITPVKCKRDDGCSRNGYYFLTEKGQMFVRGGYTVPKYIYLFNNKPYGFSDEMVDVKIALGNKFNYKELMEG